MPGRGLWAAGAFATRALVQAAAQELRAAGIHVALLAVDATIDSPKTEAFTQGTPQEALAEMSEIAKAVCVPGRAGRRGPTPTSWWSRRPVIAGCPDRSARCP